MRRGAQRCAEVCRGAEVLRCRLLEHLRRASLRLCRGLHRLLATPLRPVQLRTQLRTLVRRALARLVAHPARPTQHRHRKRAAASPGEHCRHCGMLRRGARVRGALRVRLEAARLQRGVRRGAERCREVQCGGERCRAVQSGGAPPPAAARTRGRAAAARDAGQPRSPRPLSHPIAPHHSSSRSQWHRSPCMPRHTLRRAPRRAPRRLPRRPQRCPPPRVRQPTQRRGAARQPLRRRWQPR